MIDIASMAVLFVAYCATLAGVVVVLLAVVMLEDTSDGDRD